MNKHTPISLFDAPHLSWEQLLAAYEPLAQLAQCPQDAFYHAEGDVLKHTKMVINELKKMPAYKQLDKKAQTILYIAALLHDIGKPATTTLEENGRISSKGHAKVGEKMARFLLAQENMDWQTKEEICGLVRHHGLPIWFLEKNNPQKTLLEANCVCNLYWLSILAEADIRGRICQDQENMLLKITLFREFCIENKCYDKKYHFFSDHSRFLYFHKEDKTPDYQAYDNTQMTVYLMCGLPGAGKNTWIAQNLPHLPVVALDDIRQELAVDFKDNQGQVLQMAEERAKSWLRKKQSFVWNATNLIRQRRRKLIDLFASYGARIVIVWLHKPLETILAQNKQRPTPVKEAVIYQFLERTEAPNLTEAQEVWVVE